MKTDAISSENILAAGDQLLEQEKHFLSSVMNYICAV